MGSLSVQLCMCIVILYRRRSRPETRHGEREGKENVLRRDFITDRTCGDISSIEALTPFLKIALHRLNVRLWVGACIRLASSTVQESCSTACL